MKVYFTASSLYKNQNKAIYGRIVTYLENQDHEVFANILSEELPPIHEVSSHNVDEWHKEWESHIKACDVVIIEASYPSTIHIGYEIGTIAATGKPLILLFQEGKDPVRIRNNSTNRFIKSEYSHKTLEDTLKWCLEEAEKLANRRFTFFISPEIELFLNKVVKETHVSRSEYIRKLIGEEMRKES